MNPRFEPATAANATQLRKTPSAAIVTPSYAGDLERCRLLCETIDRQVSNMTAHYILVAGHDLPLFAELEGPRRHVIDENELLPHWLHALPDPLAGFRRRIWLSTRTMPLRGWHVQQLRRIALAGVTDQDMLIFCDSDVAFLKPFDCGHFWRDGQVGLFRRDDALRAKRAGDHGTWSKNAGRALGIPSDQTSDHDYIGTLIAWRRETVTAMCERIERVHGRHWVEVVGSRRRFSECMLYGRYVDEVIDGNDHFHQHEALCHIYWSGPELNRAAFASFVEHMAPGQVAIGIQSFTGTDLGLIRDLIAKS